MKRNQFPSTPTAWSALRAGLFATLLVTGAARLAGQAFDSGSDGVLGDVVIAANTIIDLPPDGRLRYKTLVVNAGVRVRFTHNLRNTGVYILSQGDVNIQGVLDVTGSAASGNTPVGGVGGPGGFDGGKPGFGSEVPPGNGYGPGGGIAGDSGCNDNSAGGGGFGSRRNNSTAGSIYGAPALIPLVGGSGGAGSAGLPGSGGGGGGGAILIASNTKIRVDGAVQALGGGNSTCINGGSGGAIRLVAPRVEGTGQIDVRNGGNSGDGRIRIDAIDKSGITFQFLPIQLTTFGGNLVVFPQVAPRLETFEVAGTAVDVTAAPPTIILPFGSTPNRTIKIRARDFGRNVPIRVTLTPDSGPALTFDAEVDNTTVNPATVTVPVTVPINTLVTVHCWTR